MDISGEDFKRLALEVRLFLGRADLVSRMVGSATLYLEFPSVGTMHAVHREIVDGMLRELMTNSPNGQFWTYPDSETVRFEPYAGVAIVLTCKQRFLTQTGRNVGYRDIPFVSRKD